MPRRWLPPFPGPSTTPWPIASTTSSTATPPSCRPLSGRAPGRSSRLCRAGDGCQPLILTNSLGDKVLRLLETLHLAARVGVLGDTRQYDMDPTWAHRFRHPLLGDIQIWPVSAERSVDLRRPVYHRALLQAAADGSHLAVVADTFSLPGALPLMMGIPFFLLRTPYTPDWCARAVSAHPLGRVLGGPGRAAGGIGVSPRS